MQNVKLYKIRNNKLEIAVTETGAAIQSIIFHKEDGTGIDVALGYDTAEAYADNPNSLGAVPGRFANRIGGAAFELDGKEYHTDKNENENTLHGGFDGYVKRVFTYMEEESAQETEPSVKLHLSSPDGDQGMPGNLELTVTYTLTADNELIMKYEAICDQDTYINSTNHSYFNLSGHDHGCIDADHEFCIYADAYLPVDGGLIPTGEIASVEGNKFDLRKLALLPVEDEVTGKREDYDHCLVLGGVYGPMRKAATVYSTTTGIQMDVETDLPGIQFYTANGLEDTGKNGTHYGRKSSFCLETEFFPDNMHHDNFEKSIIKAGVPFTSQTVFRFSELER